MYTSRRTRPLLLQLSLWLCWLCVFLFARLFLLIYTKNCFTVCRNSLLVNSLPSLSSSAEIMTSLYSTDLIIILAPNSFQQSVPLLPSTLFFMNTYPALHFNTTKNSLDCLSTSSFPTCPSVIFNTFPYIEINAPHPPVEFQAEFIPQKTSKFQLAQSQL